MLKCYRSKLGLVYMQSKDRQCSQPRITNPQVYHYRTKSINYCKTTGGLAITGRADCLSFWLHIYYTLIIYIYIHIYIYIYITDHFFYILPTIIINGLNKMPNQLLVSIKRELQFKLTTKITVVQHGVFSINFGIHMIHTKISYCENSDCYSQW